MATPQLTGADLGDELPEFAALITKADGVAPFNEATLLNPAEREARVIRGDSGDLDALALVRTLDEGGVEAELAVAPHARGLGLGQELVHRVRAAGAAVFWAHGDLPPAQRLASATGLTASRRLYVLERPLTDDEFPATQLPSGARIRPFNRERDARDWVELNARVFADHPEQGALQLDDLDDRIAQPWFNADDFLVLEGAGGVMLGYNWLKVTDDEAEIYVIGVAPEAAGTGFGKALMQAGLRRLRDSGADTAVLYVDGDNDRAVELYRKLGFTERSVDVQYR
ncbi:mycothiol synthase [Gulosibacter faecalis]|uniref:Mycothiol synthase n=1 Tax=Gulosibacter faecalis TaxID=272240 RepID=A0ABW5UTJ7_9MICO|nr:mycothiol synthase [Gulosibacter faecalis]